MPFTDKQIAALKPRVQRYERMEPGRTGLGMRVTPNGAKTWTFRYRFDGDQRRMVFGTYPKMGVAKAHVALADAREKLRMDIDPGAVVAEDRAAELNAETVSELIGEYVERHAKPNMKPSSAAEDERLLRREVASELGGRKAKDISRRDLIRLLDAIEDRGAPITRNRTAGVLSRLFRFGMDRGIVDASPATGIRRLDENSRDRFLTPQEIHALWHGLDDIAATPVVRAAIRFLLVTGQRRAEVAGTVRSEIDDAEALWRLPALRAKNGRENIIPLPQFAMRIVEDADKCRVRSSVRPNRKDRVAFDATPSPYLFPSRLVGRPVKPDGITQGYIRGRDKLGVGDAVIHDLRRTFATCHGEIGTPPEILSALLNHAPTTMTAKVYNRATNIEPRRRAMEQWCDWLALVTTGRFDAAKKMQGAEVVELHNAHAAE